MSYKRKMTREVRVGDVKIGGNNPISVQSMTILIQEMLKRL